MLLVIVVSIEKNSGRRTQSYKRGTYYESARNVSVLQWVLAHVLAQNQFVNHENKNFDSWSSSASILNPSLLGKAVLRMLHMFMIQSHIAQTNRLYTMNASHFLHTSCLLIDNKYYSTYFVAGQYNMFYGRIFSRNDAYQGGWLLRKRCSF